MNNYKSEIEGWCDFDKFYEEIISINDNAIFVEIGCWLGQSSAIMADFIKKSGKNIKFYVIDTFEGAISYQPQIDFVKKNGGNIFNLFWKNMQRYNLHHYIVPIISNSKDGYKYIKEKELDFVFIDGDHSFEFIKNDVEIYWPLIKKGGILSGHDYCHDVKLVVDSFFEKLDLKVEFKHNSAWCVKK